MLVLKVLCEVDLQFWFMDCDHISVGDGHNVNFLLLCLLGGHGPLPDADSDLMVGDGVPVLEGVDLQLVLVVPNHAPKLPVGVRGVFVPQSLLLLQYLSLLRSPLLPVLLQLLHFFDNIRPSSIYNGNYWISKGS